MFVFSHDSDLTTSVVRPSVIKTSKHLSFSLSHSQNISWSTIIWDQQSTKIDNQASGVDFATEIFRIIMAHNLFPPFSILGRCDIQQSHSGGGWLVSAWVNKNGNGK